MSTGSQSQQSWAAWLLDAYANSVVTGHDDLTDSDYSETMSPATTEASCPADSPYGPYVRTGRGGAGNYQWQSEQNSDVEAQLPTLREKRKLAMAIEHIDTAAAVRHAQARNDPQYARIGRSLNNVAVFQSNSPQPSPTAANFARSPASASPAVYTGRGGAGNLAAARSASEQAKLAKEKREQVEAAKRREQAKQHVESMLQPPTQAYIGTRRRSALPEDLDGQKWN